MAQSRAAGDGFAEYWMHNAWVTMAGEKMSKSLGNTLLVTEIVKRWRPVEVRYYLGAAHYRSNVEFSEGALDEAAAAYRRIENFLDERGTVRPLGSRSAAGRLRGGDGRRPRRAGRARRGARDRARRQHRAGGRRQGVSRCGRCRRCSR